MDVVPTLSVSDSVIVCERVLGVKANIVSCRFDREGIIITRAVDNALVAEHCLGVTVQPLSVKWLREVFENSATINHVLDGATAAFVCEIDNPVRLWTAELLTQLGNAVGVFVVENIANSAVFDTTLDSVSGEFLASQPNKVSFDVTLDGFIAEFTDLSVNHVVLVDCALDGATADFDASYDVNVMRYMNSQVKSQSDDAKGLTLSVMHSSDTTETLTHNNVINRDDAAHLQTCIDSNTSQTVTEFLAIASSRDDGIIISTTTRLLTDVTTTLKIGVGFVEDGGRQQSVSHSVLTDPQITLRTDTLVNTGDCLDKIYHVIKRTYQHDTRYRPHYQTLGIAWEQDSDSPYIRIIAEPNPYTDYLVSVGKYQQHNACQSSIVTQRLLKNICQTLEGGNYPLHGKTKKIAGKRPLPTPQPPDHQTITIPTRQTYAMKHTVLAKILSSNTEIQLSKISLSYDAESYAWQFSGSLANKADLAHFDLSALEPVQLSIIINSYEWLVIVEEIPETKIFGKTDIQLSGRSISALLSDPWAQVSSYLQGSDMTVQQIADALAPFDWTIDWQCPTWLVPANSFSYTQQTPIQALKTIANQIGAILYPVPNSKILRVQPRYPVLPWNYELTGITPDLVIPDAAIESIGIKSRISSPINGVYVHGTTATGVLARCVLSGTAGDVLAPTESNSLITDVMGAKALAERILAGKYTQPTVTSVSTFLGDDFPLATVGSLVSVNGELATVSGISIDVDFPKVKQTLNFGENTNNLYARLIGMLPKSPLLVGTVQSSLNGVAILSLVGGGVIIARGDGVVGQSCFVRDGLIESQAPGLDGFDIVI